MNKNLLEEVKSKVNTPKKVFRQGTRENLRSSKMSTGTSTIVETSGDKKLTESGMMGDNNDKTIISDDMAIQIIKRKEQEFVLRGILPLSKNLKNELLNGVQLSADQKRELATMSQVFPNLKLGDKNEHILYFMGEYIHDSHLFGKQLKAIESNMDIPDHY